MQQWCFLLNMAHPFLYCFFSLWVVLAGAVSWSCPTEGSTMLTHVLLSLWAIFAEIWRTYFSCIMRTSLMAELGSWQESMGQSRSTHWNSLSPLWYLISWVVGNQLQGSENKILKERKQEKENKRARQSVLIQTEDRVSSAFSMRPFSIAMITELELRNISYWTGAHTLHSLLQNLSIYWYQAPKSC